MRSVIADNLVICEHVRPGLIFLHHPVCLDVERAGNPSSLETSPSSRFLPHAKCVGICILVIRSSRGRIPWAATTYATKLFAKGAVLVHARLGENVVV